MSVKRKNFGTIFVKNRESLRPAVGELEQAAEKLAPREVRYALAREQRKRRDWRAVCVENVERAERRQETGFFLNAFHEAFRKGDSAAVYADEYEIILIGILVFVTDFLRDFVDQCGYFLRIHQVGFVWSGIHVHRSFRIELNLHRPER